MTAIEGASPQQRAILEQILGGLPSTKVRALRVAPEFDLEPEPDEHGTPPPGWDPTRPLGDALRLVDPVSPDLRTGWELELIGAAFHRASADAGLTPIVGAFSQQGGPYFWEGDSAPPAARPDRAAEEARIRAAAEEAGAVVERIEFLEPDGIAVAVTLRVPEAHQFLRKSLSSFTEASGHNDQARAGSYLEVRDGATEPVYQLGCSGSGCMSSSRRDVACCAPGGLSRPILDPGPPPCPAFGADALVR